MENFTCSLVFLVSFLIYGSFEYPSAKEVRNEICKSDHPKWDAKCPEWAAHGLCSDPKRKVFMEKYCKHSCKLPCPPEPSAAPNTKPPSPPAFCRDRDTNCKHWKSLGGCNNVQPDSSMAIYCGVTCDVCKAPTPDECYDKKDVCDDIKKAGNCTSTYPPMEYEVKTYCLETCEFCVPDIP